MTDHLQQCSNPQEAMNSNNWLSFPLSPTHPSLPTHLHETSQSHHFSLGLVSDNIDSPFQNQGTIHFNFLLFKKTIQSYDYYVTTSHINIFCDYLQVSQRTITLNNLFLYISYLLSFFHNSFNYHPFSLQFHSF